MVSPGDETRHCRCVTVCPALRIHQEERRTSGQVSLRDGLRQSVDGVTAFGEELGQSRYAIG
jgi:hypothetical protein